MMEWTIKNESNSDTMKDYIETLLKPIVPLMGETL